MRVLVTGANGCGGKNLLVYLQEASDVEVLTFTRDNSIDELSGLVARADFIFHLAGVNRPLHAKEFHEGNASLTQSLCDALKSVDSKIPLLYTSAIQAHLENPYGQSKSAAEQFLLELAASNGNPVSIFRLPNVFGKWCRPNYNSAVATFCHNISRDLPVHINDPLAAFKLVYIDDVIDAFLTVMTADTPTSGQLTVSPVYETTVGDLVSQINRFKDSRDTLISEPVGSGFVRALYSTYVSYLPTDAFTYEVPKYGDERGVFVEMLKTADSGQFSYFTAHPGVTRGGHYHHSKTEKFLVIKGEARFGFRNIVTDEYYELVTNGETPEVVETVPGWTHDITNVGSDEMVVMLWANEIFDREQPDTFACQVKK